MLLLIFTSSRVYAQQSPIIGTNSDSRIQITIHSFTTATSITYYPNTPSHTGYVWGIADLTITDLQAAGTVSINSLYAHIKDSQNYVYNSEVTLDPQRLNLAELPAGQSQRGNVYWEIPVNTNIASFYWYDYSSNLAIPALATPSPTPTATPIPTPSPTVTPTQAPTTTPTPSVYPPTATPTLTPTANPTLNPNLQPTQSPMPSPTIPELGLFSIGCAALVLVAVLAVAKRWNQKSLS